MADYFLSSYAEDDLLNISIYGYTNYGSDAADQYGHKLYTHFQLIAENPYMFQAVDHIRAGHRRSVCGAHTVYYRVLSDGVEISRIIGRQDPKKALFE